LLGPDFAGIFIQFVILVFSLSVHEAAHAWSADRLGDPTARQLGRVSINPVVHVDPIGTILFPLIAMIYPVPWLIGWAKPVPVSVENLRSHWRQKYMLIAAAGPVSNIVLAIVSVAALWVISGGPPHETVQGPAGRILFRFVTMNVLLAVFNMVPIPPLDGGNVLAGLVGGRAAVLSDYIRPFGFIIIFGLALTGVLWTVIGPIANAVETFLL
jgi:Zn-dependent protease